MLDYVVIEIDQLVSYFSNRLLAVRKEDSQTKFRRIRDIMQVHFSIIVRRIWLE